MGPQNRPEEGTQGVKRPARRGLERKREREREREKEREREREKREREREREREDETEIARCYTDR